MKNARKVSQAFWLAVFFSVCAPAQEVPQLQGFVNDNAKVLGQQQRFELQQKLEDYNRLTGFEVVVLTVPSLQGATVEDYAANVQSHWRRHVLFLVAPKERKGRIQVAHDVEQFLTDAQSANILRERVAVHTKGSNNWQAGVIAGAAGILEALGNKPLQARLQDLQKEADQQQRREAETANQAEASAEHIVEGIVAIGLVALFIFWPMRRNSITNQIAAVVQECLAKIDVHLKEIPKAKDLLDELRALLAEQQLRPWVVLYRGIAAESIKLSARIDWLSRNLSWRIGPRKHALQQLSTMSRVTISQKLGFVGAATKQIAEVRSAIDAIPARLENLAQLLPAIQASMGTPGVPAVVGQWYEEANGKFLMAQGLLGSVGVTDAVRYQVGLMLQETQETLQKAAKAAKQGQKHHKRYIRGGGVAVDYVDPEVADDGSLIIEEAMYYAASTAGDAVDFSQAAGIVDEAVSAVTETASSTDYFDGAGTSSEL